MPHQPRRRIDCCCINQRQCLAYVLGDDALLHPHLTTHYQPLKTKNIMEQNRVIEINGVKMEVDLRDAKRIDQIRIGSKIKVLRKKYSGHEVLHGVVIGFEPFKTLPTIIIAAATIEYNEAKVEFIYYNAETKEMDVVVANEDDAAALDQGDFVKKVDREIAKKEMEIQELNQRKQYFLDKFKIYWTPMTVEGTEAAPPPMATEDFYF